MRQTAAGAAAWAVALVAVVAALTQLVKLGVSARRAPTSVAKLRRQSLAEQTSRTQNHETWSGPRGRSIS